MKDQRVAAAKRIRGVTGAPPPGSEKDALLGAVHDALLASKICSYAQGMQLIRAGSDAYKWNISLKEMARIWKGGCIIRARLLDNIMRAYERAPDLPNLLVDEEFEGRMHAAQPSRLRADAGHPDAVVLREPRVLRQHAHGAPAAEPHASAARRLRRPHL
jgi:6-phosphogluconate dehydrogenase